MKKLLVLLLISAVFQGLISTNARAQTNPTVGGFVVRVLQGRERNLPEDFVAHISGDELNLTLKSLGVDQGGANQDLVVTLIQPDGSKVEATPDADGNVKFNKFSNGLSALVVTGQQAAYAAMAFYIDQKNKAGDNPLLPDAAPAKSSSFNVPLANVNRNTVRSAVDSAGTAPFGGATTSLKDFTTQVASRFRVYLQPDGSLLGRVIVPEEGFQQAPGRVNLSFYRNGSVVANTVTSNNGDFFVKGLSTGVHSVFATGPSGHAAYSFEIVPGNELPKVSGRIQGRALLVTTRAEMRAEMQQASDELVVLLIPPRLMPAVRETVDDSYPLTPPVTVDPGLPLDAGFAPPMDFLPFSGAGGFAGAGGGMSGGASGAGGGGAGAGAGGLGGGLGGLGGLLGVGGLAAGAAAISSNSNDNFVLPPASLITP